MKTVLLTPGFKQNLHNRNYAATLQAIESSGYSTEFVPINWSRTTIEDWVKQLETRYAHYEPHDTILAGFSFGAMTALVAAAQRNPSELWLFSLSPYFAEDLTRYSDAGLSKDMGIHRATSFRSLSFADLAKNIHCRTLLFIGDKEAERWPTLEERITNADGLLKNSRIITIPKGEHDVTSQGYIEAIAKTIDGSRP